MSGADTQTAKNKIGQNTGNRGRGRPKGAPNKNTAAVKDMILSALNGAHKDGGAAYLKDQAEKNPVAFMTLVGKVLPLQLAGDPSNPIGIQIIERRIIG